MKERERLLKGTFFKFCETEIVPENPSKYFLAFLSGLNVINIFLKTKVLNIFFLCQSKNDLRYSFSEIGFVG